MKLKFSLDERSLPREVLPAPAMPIRDIELFMDKIRSKSWWSLSGSNRRPHPCKGCALPSELRPH